MSTPSFVSSLKPIVTLGGVIGCVLFGGLLVRSPFIALALVAVVGCFVVYLTAPQWMVYAALFVAFTAVPAAIPPGKALGPSLIVFFYELLIVLAIVFLIPLNRARGKPLSTLWMPLVFCAMVSLFVVVGILNGNFTVRDLAEAASRAMPGCSLTFTGEHGKDSRSYRVSFHRILTELQPWFRPAWDLDRGGRELIQFFRETGFNEEDFTGRRTIRLEQLKHLVATGVLSQDLRWAT